MRTELDDLVAELWPEFLDRLRRSLTGQRLPLPLLLPLAGCSVAGGDPDRAIPVSAACGALLLAARWFDDLEDRDRDDALWCEVGGARATNMAAFALSLAWTVMTREDRTPRAVLRAFGDATATLARGQDIDLRGEIRSVDDCWTLMRTKTAPAYVFATTGGAMCAGAGPEVIQALARYGTHLGVLLQLLDDLDGVFDPVGDGDLSSGKVTLPLVLAMTIDHPQRLRLRSVVEGGRLKENADWVRATLLAEDLRAPIIWAALQQHGQAQLALATLPTVDSSSAEPGRAVLESLLDAGLGHVDELRDRPG